MCKQNKVLLRISIISEVCNAIMVSVGGQRRRQCGLNGAQGFDGWQEVNKWWLFIIRPSPGRHTHTHSHTPTYIHSERLEMDQRWNAVSHWPIQSEGDQAWRRPSHMRGADWGTGADSAKTTRPRRRCRGESWGQREERLLPRYRQADRRDQSEPTEPFLTCPVGVSHTPTHTSCHAPSTSPFSTVQ